MGTFIESDNDVILLCTSILSLSSVVKSMPLQNLNRPTLFVDVLSVKEHPREVLLQVVPEESDLLCTHPMFGPESAREGWKGLNFMYDRVRIRDEATCSTFLHVFQSEVIFNDCISRQLIPPKYLVFFFPLKLEIYFYLKL